MKEKIIEILEELLHIKVRYDGEKLSDMGADSLDLIELANALEDEFNIRIENKELADKNMNLDMSVRDLVNLVKELKNE